ncbi:MAG: hypothetical protein M4579_001230 [Chaenotheca gracillima]|nr:MAG: hypothetical protein M4579_001230 [Chaenotheca gracillima]
MATAAGPHPVSPSSSPRLPSPPPFTEVQIGPRSPTLGDEALDAQLELGAQNEKDGGAMRRIRPGTKAEDMASGPPLVPLGELDSPFQLQEHLAALHWSLTHPDENSTVPLNHAASAQLATPPPGIDRSLWLYELCRLVTNKINTVIVSFFADSPPCSSVTCPEMRASEWQYLCAVHDPPKPCCAIDYCCHTLDWAANMLTSSKHFPSRLTLGNNPTATGPAPETNTAASQQPLRNLTNIFRRLYRIFAHAWYQHRSVFWAVEGQTGLYLFFKTVCDQYQLIPEDNYTVPAEAEGLESAPSGDGAEGTESSEPPALTERPSFILRKESAEQTGEAADQESAITESNGTDLPPPYSPKSTSRAQKGESSSSGQLNPSATRRHKQSPSIGSAVDTVLEEEEEEGGSDAAKQENVEISKPDSPVEGVEQADPKEEDHPMTEATETAEQEPEKRPEEAAAEDEKGDVHGESKDDEEAVDQSGEGTKPDSAATDDPASTETTAPDAQPSSESKEEAKESKGEDAKPASASLAADESKTEES